MRITGRTRHKRQALKIKGREAAECRDHGEDEWGRSGVRKTSWHKLVWTQTSRGEKWSRASEEGRTGEEKECAGLEDQLDDLHRNSGFAMTSLAWEHLCEGPSQTRTQAFRYYWNGNGCRDGSGPSSSSPTCFLPRPTARLPEAQSEAPAHAEPAQWRARGLRLWQSSLASHSDRWPPALCESARSSASQIRSMVSERAEQLFSHKGKGILEDIVPQLPLIRMLSPLL